MYIILHILKVQRAGGTPPEGSKCVECHGNHFAGAECNFDRHDNHLAGGDCHYDKHPPGGGCHFSVNLEFSLNYVIWITLINVRVMDQPLLFVAIRLIKLA